jgi:hypothetical protein
MDFLFGKPEQTGQLDPQTEAARNFLLNQMLEQYSAGPVDVPQYQAVAPAAMYSGTNDLLSSLGLGTVAPPSMPTVNVGGVEAYSSQPFQEQIETAYGERYPGQYEFLRSFYRDRVTGEPGTRAYGYVDPNAAVTMPGGGGGGGNQYNNSDSDSTAAALQTHYDLFPETAPGASTYGYVNNDGFIDAPAPSSGFMSGGGADGVGNFGAVGDFFGGIGNALGITDYKL